ncbi:MAG: hypothetical protein ABSD85_14470 [Acidimicrobiales bacterium]
MPSHFAIKEEASRRRTLYNEVLRHENLGFLTPLEVCATDPGQSLPDGDLDGDLVT